MVSAKPLSQVDALISFVAAMRFACFLLFWCISATLHAQQNFTFTRFSADGGEGLSSNTVYSLYQDEKGFIWVGTANGLQRFDGSKFIHFGSVGDAMPFSAVNQIIPLANGRLLLNFHALHETGIFDPAHFTYKKLAIHPQKALPSKADYLLWRDAQGEVFLVVSQYGLLHYNAAKGSFEDDSYFPLPAGYFPSTIGIFEDTLKGQVWFACAKGLCVYDRQSQQMWYSDRNPKGLALLKNEELQDHPSEFFIDRQRRIWIFGWPQKKHRGQVKYCLDSTGVASLQADTVGLNTGPVGYVEYHNFLDTRRTGLWIYGVDVLFNWDAEARRFHYTRSTAGNGVNSIQYTVVYRLMEDRDGNIWAATDRGLYFTSSGSGTFGIVNYLFDNSREQNNINDILELPNGELWAASWGKGVLVLDSSLREKAVPVFAQPPPAAWPELQRSSVKLAWSLFYEKRNGEVWIGSNHGTLMKYNLARRTTQYLLPEACGLSTIRYITEDALGQIWIGTQNGRLVKWDGTVFTLVQNIGTLIYKIFTDKQNNLWLATEGKGLLQIDPQSGKIQRQFTKETSGLYSNTGEDIEQLNDSTIVYGAGALNFINKRTGKVRLLRFEDGLPSNSVRRLRMDAGGFLWLVTANGLSRYNPHNNRITTYGRKDGITLAEQTTDADYRTKAGYVVFAGGDALMLFKPSLFASTHEPPDAVITDFKIFNQFIPVDSLLRLPRIKLSPDENSFSIYFSSLSYQQRDRLTYFFKMEGIDKDWQAADGVYFQNYSLLPPGNYTFKVYAVNVEGIRSAGTTELRITVKPPFYRTKWFLATLVFLILLIIYFLHRERVHRLLAVEKIRNRVARDLHDDMGSTLSTINILSAMAKSKMATDPVKTAGYISKISDNSQRMMEAMDDIVWSIKPSNDTMQRITARMREFATGVLEAKDIALQFIVAEDVADVKLNMEARRDFFLIFKEALNNSAKYSKATKVIVTVSVQAKQLSFIIKDNGSGFDVAKADGGNGLGNMQKRADGMRGKLRIRSAIGEGTEVKLMVPVG